MHCSIFNPSPHALTALVVCLVAVALVPIGMGAQTDPQRARGSVERIKVHGKGLEGNLSGDSPDREVSVYLPPSYRTDTNRHYPVVYFLHGFTDSDAQWFGFQKHWINAATVIDKSLTEGASREMIVVTPNAYTRFFGSMYSNSVTTGDWEDFVAKELVAYVDAHYRTIPASGSRGLAGHSMGGYGAIRIGMKKPSVFSAVYLLSPCCMTPDAGFTPDSDRLAKAESVHSQEELAKADFMTKATFASAAAWSPNPANPPFFLDLPSKNGALQSFVIAKWTANAPLAMIDQYITNIRQLRAISFDAGAQDERIAATTRDLDRILTSYGIQHGFEIYEGDHINHVGERIEKQALPFFTKNLSFDKPR